MKTNLLKDNITSILTLIVVSSVLLLIRMILLKEIRVEKETAFLLIGILSGALSTVLSYYYGTTKSDNERKRVETENKAQEQSVKKTVETTVSPATEVKQESKEPR